MDIQWHVQTDVHLFSGISQRIAPLFHWFLTGIVQWVVDGAFQRTLDFASSGVQSFAPMVQCNFVGRIRRRRRRQRRPGSNPRARAKSYDTIQVGPTRPHTTITLMLVCVAWGVACHTGTVQGHRMKYHPRGPPVSITSMT